MTIEETVLEKVKVLPMNRKPKSKAEKSDFTSEIFLTF